MRWPISAFFLFALAGSVLSTEADDEPSLQILSRSSIYNVGDRKAIFCKGKNIKDTIEWYSPTNTLIEERSNKNTRIYVEHKNEKDGVMVPLLIHYTKLSDNGFWTCRAGELNQTIEIYVGEKVNITNKLVEVEGEENGSIKLPCEARGYPTPVVVWFRRYEDEDGKIEERSIKVQNRSKYIIKANNDTHINTLEIKKLNHEDVGTYICKLRQKVLSHYAEKVFQLTVQHKPILYDVNTKAVYTKTVEVFAILNEMKVITCSAIANPQAVYRWFRRNNSFDVEFAEDDDRVKMSDDGSSSLLTLPMYDESYLGEYKCSAENSRGTESVIFDVSLGTKPNPPDFVELITANVTEMIFNVTCSTCIFKTNDEFASDPTNLPVIGYTFQMVPLNDSFPIDWDQGVIISVDVITADDTLFTVGPLPNSTTFHARVRSRNDAGDSDWFDITPDPWTIAGANQIVTCIVLYIIGFVFTVMF